MNTETQHTPPPRMDQGLHCLICDYNLTGLTSSRCPECGTEIDWKAVQAARDQMICLPGTPWDSWPWYSKPLAFLATMGLLAFMPWRFARELPRLPHVRWAVGFAAICFVMAFIAFIGREPGEVKTVSCWLPCAFLCLLFYSFFLCILLPPRYGKHPFDFWLTVCCYACYPLPIEAITGSIPMIFIGDSAIWPFSGGHKNWVTNILFYLWCFNLLIVGAVRCRRKDLWRLLPIAISFPLVTMALTYLALAIY